MSSSSYTEKSSGVKAPSPGKVKSPSSTPEEATQNCGGMPPEKNEKQINEENSPKKAPGAVHGV